MGIFLFYCNIMPLLSCTSERSRVMRLDLPAGTTYYYRAYATNATGTVYGEERTMTTN